MPPAPWQPEIVGEHRGHHFLKACASILAPSPLNSVASEYSVAWRECGDCCPLGEPVMRSVQRSQPGSQVLLFIAHCHNELCGVGGNV